ncbi:hypothetical protein GCM10010129_06300 [Streptomyces fumigatiscleroticus]|nr:hypothetical protein GCM10010129_06300 [Streptomyces fumigatiscleroticus]
MLMPQSLLDSQAATLSQVPASAAWATPVPMSGRAIPAPPAVTVSEARLILFGWYRRCRPRTAMNIPLDMRQEGQK